MTEAIKLPGTEMEVIEKYPLSRRLDHPDFGDVCKTTYAKGVITDVKMAIKSECDPLFNYPTKGVHPGVLAPTGPDQVDPFRVKSLVKVEIEGQESEWLPLFSHPKAKMWDDTNMVVSDENGDEHTVNPGVLATDYNTDEGYFEKAWMSFRPQDEVVVMLKEGVPVAVMGFADGVPRVGEAVFRVNISEMQPGGTLGTETSRYVQIAEMKLNPDGAMGSDGTNLNLTKLVEPMCNSYQMASINDDMDGHFYYKEWLLILGPKLVIITHYAEKIIYKGFYSYSPPFWTLRRVKFYVALATKDNVEIAQTLGIAHSGLDLCYPLPAYPGQLFAWFQSYQNQLWNIPGFYEQSDVFVYGTGNLVNLCSTGSNGNMFNSIYVRPHTKAELQAAGMWPGA